MILFKFSMNQAVQNSNEEEYNRICTGFEKLFLHYFNLFHDARSSSLLNNLSAHYSLYLGKGFCKNDLIEHYLRNKAKYSELFLMNLRQGYKKNREIESLRERLIQVQRTDGISIDLEKIISEQSLIVDCLFYSLMNYALIKSVYKLSIYLIDSLSDTA